MCIFRFVPQHLVLDISVLPLMVSAIKALPLLVLVLIFGVMFESKAMSHSPRSKPNSTVAISLFHTMCPLIAISINKNNS